VLDDGTAAATVVLPRAAAFQPALRLGEVLNVVGRVRPRSGGLVEVVVRSDADITRASLSLPSATAAPVVSSALLSASLDGPASATTAVATPGPVDQPWRAVVTAFAVVLALVAVVLIGVAGLAVLRPDALARWPRRPGRDGDASPRDPNGPTDGVRIGPV
jgi:hypothetical protein